MRNSLRTYSIIAGVAALAGCAGTQTTSEVGAIDMASFNGARVEVLGEGGIAALSTLDRVEHDSRAYVHVMRHICARDCQAPLDSASGVAAANAVDSLFNIVLAQKYAFKDDYGLTPGSADMMVYTVRITSGGTTKSVRADDGTMPGALRQVVDAVRATVSAARK